MFRISGSPSAGIKGQKRETRHASTSSPKDKNEYPTHFQSDNFHLVENNKIITDHRSIFL